jgi:hypothetical protein
MTVNGCIILSSLARPKNLYVVLGPLTDNPNVVRAHNPTEALDPAKKEIMVARMCAISAQSTDQYTVKS